MGRGQTARSAEAAAGATSSVSARPSGPAAQQPVSVPPAARQPTMLNFGASLQQAAVSHLGMPCPPRLATSERPAGREPEPPDCRAGGPGLQRSRGGVGRFPACRRGSGEGGCVARGSGEAAWDVAPRERQVCSRCSEGKGHLRGETGGK